jgi:molybdopterin-synthase adenylyltransferase
VRYPRIKHGHQPFRVAPETVRIGGEIYGLAAEIPDPDGLVWQVLRLMDGTRTVEQLTTAVAAPGPRVEAVLKALLSSPYVEDAEAAIPPELTGPERLRYSRNHAYFHFVERRPGRTGWDAQLRLKASAVLVVGLGGTGSHAAWALAAAGVGRLHLVDADLVEPSNLTRQVLYDEADVGRPKAEAARSRLRAVNGAAEITAECRRVDSRSALAALLTGFDALALCADEPRGPDGIRVWASRACARAGIAWAGGGYHGPLVTVGVFAPGGPCYECLQAGEAARRPHDHPIDLGGGGVVATSAGLSGQLVAHGVISVLTGAGAGPPGYVTGVNLIAPDHNVYVRHPKRAKCGFCGESYLARSSDGSEDGIGQ